MKWRGTAALARASMPILTRLDPELAHHLALAGLKTMSPCWRAPPIAAGLRVRCFGLSFAHPLGLAAGFDKNGDYLDALGALGFSHIELGTVTPRPQPGNPKPRMFRLRSANAIVNRMGFNNKGVDHLVAQLARSKYPGIRGVSIGKNFDTPLEAAQDDLASIGGSIGAGARDLSKDVQRMLRDAQRDLKKMSRALQRDLEKLQKDLTKTAAKNDRAGAPAPAASKARPKAPAASAVPDGPSAMPNSGLSAWSSLKTFVQCAP